MHFKLLAAAGVAGLMVLSPVAAVAQTHEMKAGCCDMPCCADQMKAAKTFAEPSAIEMILAMDPQFAVAEVTAPAVQRTEVWFNRPVLVGNTILQGRYVIEHDNDRMARGEPCTYIYAFNDRTKPVVTFHCTHIERAPTGTNTVALVSIGDGMWQKMTEFQFAGETAAHGVPLR